jgi:hypothetical protein
MLVRDRNKARNCLWSSDMLRFGCEISLGCVSRGGSDCEDKDDMMKNIRSRRCDLEYEV